MAQGVEISRQERGTPTDDARFGSRFDHTPIGEALIGIDGTIRAVTARFSQMLGYADDELVGRHLTAITHPDDLAQTLRQVQALLDEVVPYLQLELRLVRKDASTLHTVTSVSPGRDDSGRVASLAMVAQDVSELKRSESDLRLLQSLTLAVSEAPDLESALDVVLRVVCESAGWSCGGAWVPTEDGNRLVASRAWYGAR